MELLLAPLFNSLHLLSACAITLAASAFAPQFIFKLKKTNITSITSTSSVMKMVLVVRQDIPMTKGKAAAQCCHACLEAYKKSVLQNPSVFLILF